MISVKMPKTAISLKKPKRPSEDKFVVTYEYGWSESTDAGNSKGQESPRLTGAVPRTPIQCSWADVAIRFPE
ncbi:MAG: hypothetical protein QXZ70_04840 [Candidatus Bathyarchaeia archaeon]